MTQNKNCNRWIWILVVGLLALECSTALEGTCTAQESNMGTCVNSASNSSATSSGSSSSSSDCQDKTSQCSYWKEVGECKDNRAFMAKRCPRSCHLCPDQLQDDLVHGVDLGERQLFTSVNFPDVTEQESLDRIVATREYVQNLHLNEEIKTFCINKNDGCTIWAVAGECDKNPMYMKTHCSPACMSCELFTVEGRCPIDRNAVPAWKEGDLDAMFTRLISEPFLSQYDVQVWSMDPWVVTIENLISKEEAERLIELGGVRGYERSKDVGSKKPDGSYGEIVTDHRTSHNAWCQSGCRNDTHVKAVKQRLSEITGLPEINSEDLQLLRYEKGQYYKSHHDYIAHNIDRQQGVRILTVFLYLNDVEAGGGTHFNSLNITITPKQGRALLWPSVLNDKPHDQDWRTFHEALPVEVGVKYGANAWFHQFDYQTPSSKGCIL
ncbi:procollagen-proline,2-oxoglutarate-4-dioxygenase [Nitzschia inconspicua]|uniref:Procollagen-proline, 2-oxoglutarate-4-dioxygenase n=1 Tax=Nitzschia inconspicua TaxID=303405 RepID=A0A9K3LV30_9STRA|nr:procollagen-proline,2-oxoglutarate-4-dioxygenase [Nitzschia inconspicua]